MGFEGAFSRVPLEALGRRPAHDGSDGPPLGWHQFGQVEQLFVLFPAPFRLLDRRVQPLEPAGFALLGRLPVNGEINRKVIASKQPEEEVIKYV